MDKTKLVEIRKGEEGTGLLIEHDGFISSDCGGNRKLFEDINAQDGDDFHCPRHFVVDAVFQKYGIENANGRIYPENVLKREEQKYQQAIKERRAYGELNHPETSVIDLGRVCMNIVELHWVGRTLIGKIEFPISEGFRKYGVVSTLADMAAQWLVSGLKIGVSSRGLGTVSQLGGKVMVNDDYEIVCWDVVSQPSTPMAWIDMEEEGIKPYIEENIEVKKDNIIIEDKFSKFDNWLNG
jgi:hypothetical protein